MFAYLKKKYQTKIDTRPFLTLTVHLLEHNGNKSKQVNWISDKAHLRDYYYK